MRQQKVNFWVKKRKNAFRKSGHEWALYCHLEGDADKQNVWVLWEWETEPKVETVERTVFWLTHAMDFASKNVYDWQPPVLKGELVNE